jgi:hypothetical protein
LMDKLWFLGLFSRFEFFGRGVALCPLLRYSLWGFHCIPSVEGCGCGVLGVFVGIHMPTCVIGCPFVSVLAQFPVN